MSERDVMKRCAAPLDPAEICASIGKWIERVGGRPSMKARSKVIGDLTDSRPGSIGWGKPHHPGQAATPWKSGTASRSTR